MSFDRRGNGIGRRNPPPFRGRPMSFATPVRQEDSSRYRPQSFPGHFMVRGTESGPRFCIECRTQLPDEARYCPSCKGTDIPHLRQVMLRFMRQNDLGIVHLEREPDNKFDPNAVKVMVHWPDGVPRHIGYVPRDLNPEKASLNAAFVSEVLATGKQLWCLATIRWVTKEQRSTYGLHVRVFDQEPTGQDSG